MQRYALPHSSTRALPTNHSQNPALLPERTNSLSGSALSASLLPSLLLLSSRLFLLLLLVVVVYISGGHLELPRPEGPHDLPLRLQHVLALLHAVKCALVPAVTVVAWWKNTR